MTFSKIVSLNSSSAFWSNSFPCIILICFKNVDFPLSPAPRSRIFTNRRIDRLSRASIASISRLRRFASRSWFGSRVSRVLSLLLLLSWLASAGSRHRLRVRTTPAIVPNYANHQLKSYRSLCMKRFEICKRILGWKCERKFVQYIQMTKPLK